MKFIFCEGNDDLAVINGVAASIGITDLNVERFKGKDKLRKFLKSFQTRSVFTQNLVFSIGIVRDADEDGDDAFHSVREALLANGFNAPAQNGGCVADGIKTGILIIGPKDGKGMIEDLCLKSVADQPEFHCVDAYFSCIAQHSGRKEFKSKAKVRVWMASHVDWEYYVGKAAEEGYWPWESPAFDPLKNFLRAL